MKHANFAALAILLGSVGGTSPQAQTPQAQTPPAQATQTQVPQTQVPQTQTAHDTMRGMKAGPAERSTALSLTGLHGEVKTLSTADFAALPHTTVTVTNGHSHQQETYSGVLVQTLLALVSAAPGDATTGNAAPHRSQRTVVVLATATDHFQVALTLCDTDPGCRSGEAIVADTMDGKPLTNDGAFKLILTDDKTPGRWARNLASLAEKNVAAQ